MSVTVIPIPVLSDNVCWAIAAAGSNRALVVDPPQAAPVRQSLDSAGLELAGILVTHHHRDHTAAVAEMAGSNPVVGPAGPNIPARTRAVGEGDRVDLEGLEFEVWHLPGHTLDHIAFIGAGLAICGDVLFAGGCGRVFEGTPDQMHTSLQRLAKLPATTQVLCGHEYTVSNLTFAAKAEPGNQLTTTRLNRCQALRAEGRLTLPSTIAEELATNPFLRADHPALRSSAETAAGRSCSTPSQVFAALRSWKDRS